MPTIVKHAIRTTEGWNSMSPAEQAQYAGYYTTLSAWELAQRRDLVTADEVAVAECFNDWPTGLFDNCIIAGWTTDATRNIIITVAEGHRHKGIPKTGFWMRHTGNWTRVLQTDVANCIFEWLNLYHYTSGANGITLQATGGTKIRNCITCANLTGISHTTGCTIHNNISYGFGAGTGFSAGMWSTNFVYNNIAINHSVGFFMDNARGNNNIYTNNIAYNNTTNYSGDGFSPTLSTNNATSSLTDNAPGDNSIVGITAADFVDPTGLDFHSAQYSRLHRMGVNLYSEGITEDIDGNPLPSTGPWDIGINYKQPNVKKAVTRKSWMMGTGTKPPPDKILVNKRIESPTYNWYQSTPGLRSVIFDARKGIDLGDRSNRYIPNKTINTGRWISNGTTSTEYDILSDAFQDLRFELNSYKKILLRGVLYLPGTTATNIILKDSVSGKGFNVKFEGWTSDSIRCQITEILSGSVSNATFPITYISNLNREIGFSLEIESLNQSISGYVMFRFKTVSLDGKDLNSTTTYSIHANSASIQRFDKFALGPNIIKLRIDVDTTSSPASHIKTIHKTSKPSFKFPIISRIKTADSYPVKRTISSPAPSLILPKKTMQQPQGPVEVDWNNPLTRDLKFAQIGNSRIDIVTKSFSSGTSYTSYYNNTFASAYASPHNPNHLHNLNSTNFTVMCKFRFENSPSGFRDIFSKYHWSDEATNNGWLIQQRADNRIMFGVFNNSSVSNYELNTLDPVANTGDILVMGISTTTIREIYLNGVLSNNKAPLAMATASNGVRFGEVNGAMRMYYGYLFNRVLTKSEYKDIQANPWQIFKPIKRRIITGV